MIPEYHPYTQLPYRTTPQLYKWGTDFGNGEFDKLIFQKDDNYLRYLKEQEEATHQGFGYNPKYKSDCEAIWGFISKEVTGNRKQGFWLQDDYVIVKVDETDQIICHSAFLPSFWRVEESLGKSLLTLHEPVPNLTLPRKTLESCVKNRYTRFVWSFIFEDKFNFHPDQNNQMKFDINNSTWFIRVERQSIIPFPSINCFLFVIKPYIVRNPKIPELCTTIKGMSQEFKDYKRITPEFERYLNTL